MAVLVMLIPILAACAAQPLSVVQETPAPAVTDSASGLALPTGYQADILATNLMQPTHVALGPDGALYLTQLNGGENAHTGQVIRIKNPGAVPEIMLDGLTKPTGLTWANGDLYVVSGNNVLVSHVDSPGKLRQPEVVFADLPFNGRSNGQIFTGPDGYLYFQSTGNENQPRDSGFIYRAKPGSKEKEIYARGLKNAYAMAWDSQTGRMYTTEIGDGAIPNVGQPPEELNMVRPAGNYGWPYCYADQKENAAWNGTRDYCADTDVPLALFAPESTPTGLAVYDGKLIVALWNGNPPRLMSVDPASGKVTAFASGFKQAIALLTVTGTKSTQDQDFDGLLVVDMGSGKLYRLAKH